MDNREYTELFTVKTYRSPVECSLNSLADDSHFIGIWDKLFGSYVGLASLDEIAPIIFAGWRKPNHIFQGRI
jgi:hypothetical protein